MTHPLLTPIYSPYEQMMDYHTRLHSYLDGATVHTLDLQTWVDDLERLSRIAMDDYVQDPCKAQDHVMAQILSDIIKARDWVRYMRSIVTRSIHAKQRMCTFKKSK